MMKRALKWIGIVFGVLLVVAGAAYYSAFGDSKPIAEGALVPGVETVKDGFVSVFLLDAGPGKVALIDAGNDKEGAAIKAALARRGLTAADVTGIFLTHGHGDHTAACKLFPGAQVYAMAGEESVVGDAAKVTHPLKDGEVVELGDLRVEALATPGHTPGSVVYLARGVLFFGDSAGATAAGEVKKAVRIFSKDPAQNLASLKALETKLEPRRAEIKELAFAHTGPIAGFDALEAFSKSY